MEIMIRRVRKEDADEICDVIESVALEKVFLATLDRPSLESTQSFIQDNLEKGYPHLVAEHNNRIIAWGDITCPFTRPPYMHIGRLGMGVLKEYRGQGVGNRLLTHLVEAAWAYGFRRLDLEVFAGNEAAINLYLKHGYEVEGRKKYLRYLDGEFEDTLVMAQYRI
ncbi:MAG: GNAT family N-acetyltransferase [Gammaproteobacteria bacterium]|nr:GNAT family N-acetyltransferase [Gammaproteobacteria bacterium]